MSKKSPVYTQPEYDGMAERIHQIVTLGTEAGWVYDASKNNKGIMLHFSRPVNGGPKEIVEVWHQKMTVSTRIVHPIRGLSRKTRHGVTMETMKAIFDNPRVHTQNGNVSEEPSYIVSREPRNGRFSYGMEQAILESVRTSLWNVMVNLPTEGFERDIVDLETCIKLIGALRKGDSE